MSGLAYGIGGLINVPTAPVKGLGVPPASFRGQLGQAYFDVTDQTNPIEYVYNGYAWAIAGANLATTTLAGVVELNDSVTMAGASDLTVPTSLAIKTYADNLNALVTPIATGGTNATSMSTSSGIVRFDGTRLVTSSTAQIDASNRQTNSSQPAFLAYNSSNRLDVTGNGDAYTVPFDTELFDQGSNFAANTFTAPVTGIYQFNCSVLGLQLSGTSSVELYLVTTARAYNYGNTAGAFAGNNMVGFTMLVPMTAGNTASVQYAVSGGAKTVDVFGDPSGPRTMFSGYLVA